jgi:ubiquinone/menaquinone biosynthesis C-methylase UbiE
LGFEDLLERRSAAEYADFVLPWIGRGDRVIDVGCGLGSITVGLARVAGHVTGVDVDGAEFSDARVYSAEHGIDNVEFLEGSIYGLDFPDASFEVCTLLSMMETLDDPLAGLAEVRRVVRPGGLVGISSIEYGGWSCTALVNRCCVVSTSCG